MTWVRVEQNAPLHTKFLLAGLPAYGWWHAALCYCNRELTDGFIPTRALMIVFPGIPPDEVQRAIEALVRERCLHPVKHGQRPECHADSRACPSRLAPEDGYVIHDIFDYQPRRI